MMMRINNFSDLKKLLLLVIGALSAVLGIVGIFLPLLPTTPFLLLAAVCFTRSSRKMYSWLLTNSLFGEQFSDYLVCRAISPRLKVGSIAFLWLAMGLSILKITNSSVRIILVLIAISVTIHLCCLKTK